MFTLIHMFFAGTWSMIWHWGLGIGLIILCLAGAYFTPAWLPIIHKKDFLYAAAIIGVFLAGEAVGINDEKKASTAREQVLQTQVEDAVANSKGKKDPFDDPRN